MNFLALIATHNAAEHLPDTLSSLTACDRIVIWDQRSTDATLDIAASHKCHVVSYPNTFYEEPETIVRNKMTDFVNEHYPSHHIVSMDSDEILSDGWDKIAREAFTVHKPGGLLVPYYQMMGDARYEEIRNPIERRILIFAPGCGPRYAGDGTTRWHQTTPRVVGDTYYEPRIRFIHMGYTGNLLKRYTTNCLRKDWSPRDDVNKDILERINKDPFVFTQPVCPTAQDLLASSSVLQAITKRHAATRDVTLDPHGPHMKIKHIHYHDRKS